MSGLDEVERFTFAGRWVGLAWVLRPVVFGLSVALLFHWTTAQPIGPEPVRLSCAVDPLPCEARLPLWFPTATERHPDHLTFGEPDEVLSPDAVETQRAELFAFPAAFAKALPSASGLLSPWTKSLVGHLTRQAPSSEPRVSPCCALRGPALRPRHKQPQTPRSEPSRTLLERTQDVRWSSWSYRRTVDRWVWSLALGLLALALVVRRRLLNSTSGTQRTAVVHRHRVELGDEVLYFADLAEGDASIVAARFADGRQGDQEGLRRALLARIPAGRSTRAVAPEQRRELEQLLR